MNWSDEPWVKLYRRNTADWLAVGWEARAVYHELLKNVNRRGQIALGKSGLRGLAVVLQMPQDVVERSIPILVEDGALVASSTDVVLVNFVEAQETRQSDAARKRAQREREKDQLDTESRTVTGHNGPSDTASQNVTSGHDVSRAVTPSHEQIRREEKREEILSPPTARARDVASVVPGMPEWVAPTVDSVALTTGLRVDHVASCWAQFVGNCTEKGHPSTPEAWLKWVTTEVRMQHREAVRARSSPRGGRIVQRDPPGPPAAIGYLDETATPGDLKHGS